MIIKPTSPNNPLIIDLIKDLDVYQSSLYPAKSNHLDSLEELSKDNVYFVAAFVEYPIGIGAIKYSQDFGEIKRVYVDPMFRGIGIAKSIVEKLERDLVKKGFKKVMLETGVLQPEAIGLYESLGYKACGPFGNYNVDPLSVFMVKEFN